MGRGPRTKSSTGVYHIMLRGIDGRNIFLDNEDRQMFLNSVMTVRKNAGFQLYGYCLMNNHVHLLIKESEEIGVTIKRITVSYVRWHNKKHSRTGHLYQNRFKSEAVETEAYLKTVIRYIHRNPVKAGITRRPEQCHWSSYIDYVNDYNGIGTSLDTSLIKSLFSDYKEFSRFTNLDNNDNCLDIGDNNELNDMIECTLQKDLQINLASLNEQPISERNRIIKDIYVSTGLSIRQLAQAINISKTIVERAVK